MGEETEAEKARAWRSAAFGNDDRRLVDLTHAASDIATSIPRLAACSADIAADQIEHAISLLVMALQIVMPKSANKDESCEEPEE